MHRRCEVLLIVLVGVHVLAIGGQDGRLYGHLTRVQLLLEGDRLQLEVVLRRRRSHVLLVAGQSEEEVQDRPQTPAVDVYQMPRETV